MDIFTQEELQAAKSHKYAGTDDSILVNYCLKYFWNWIVEFFPMNLAPTVITFVGFLAEVISFIVTFIDTDFMENEPSSFVCIFDGVMLLFYQTLDNLDGKQARRTGSSSSLGQFFDHGCDAITGCLELMKVAMVLDFGVTGKTFYFITLMGIGFLLTSWEEFVTGKFYLGYINGPDEGLFLLGAVQIAVGIAPRIRYYFQHWFFEFCFVVGFSFTIGVIIIDVIKEVKHEKTLMKKAIVSLLPCVITTVLFIVNFALLDKLFLSPFFIMLCGLMLQYGGQMIIVATLTKRSETKLFNKVTILEWIGVAFPIFFYFTDTSDVFEYYWFGFFFIHLLIMIMTDIRVIFGLSSGLGIPIFTIKPQIQPNNDELPEIVNIPDQEDFQVDEALLKEKEENEQEAKEEEAAEQQPDIDTQSTV